MLIFARRAKKHFGILLYRKVLTFALSILFSLSAFTLVLGSIDEQYGTDRHWAQSIIDAAYRNGIIQGYGGIIAEDEPVSTAQILAILSRALNISYEADISDFSNISANAWYQSYLARVAHIGVASFSHDNDFSAPATRQDAFRLVSEAFAVTEANMDSSALGDFSDSWLIRSENRQAIATLVTAGVVRGFDGMLFPNDEITLAEFLSVVNRLSGSFSFGLSADNLSSSSFIGRVWIDSGYSDISLIDTNAPCVIVRSEYLNSLLIDGQTNINRLTIAALDGDIKIRPENYVLINTVAVANGGGQVTIGGVEIVEITGRNRSVIISEDVCAIIVSGRDSSIEVDAGVSIGEIIFKRDALGGLLTLNGKVYEIDVFSPNVMIVGSGFAENITHWFSDIRIGIDHGNVVNDIDHGIQGASLSINVQEILPAGETLRATAQILDSPPNAVVEVIWSLNGYEMERQRTTSDRPLPIFTHNFEYYFRMAETAEVTFELNHVTRQGQLQTLTETIIVNVENHPIEYFAAPVRARVTSHYKGNFTLQWALENDLTDIEKELWINTGNYTSRTNYLVWVNLDYQRVNIFRWCEEYEQWRIIRTALGASGREPGQRTRTGVTYISAHQPEWRWATHVVRPIVRFWPGTGHAFHSRTIHPRTGAIIDESMGFPVSLGCIRMLCEDIWFLYNYIPLKTTVVIF